MSVKRYWVPGPWITRDLKECVLASDYDALRAKLDARLGMVTSLLVTNYDLRKERDRLQDALDALRAAAGKALLLLDYADDSDDCQYGTISTGTVRELLTDLRRLLGESHDR